MKKIAKRKAVRQRKSAKKETPVPSDKTDMDEFRDRLIKIQTESGLIKSHVSIALESHEKRSEEHTSELQSLMRHSYAVFCLKKKKSKQTNTHKTTPQHTTP